MGEEASPRKAGHRRRRRVEGEVRTRELRKDGVRCKATAKSTGEPCKSASALANGLCVSHQRVAADYGVEPIHCADGTFFGSPEQAAKAATSRASLRFPRLREVVEREIEARAEEIIRAHLEGLIATRMHVDAKGGEHESPDHDTRWRSAAALLDRALGKPGPSEETARAPAQFNALMLVTDEGLRAKARELARAVDASRRESARGGAGEEAARVRAAELGRALAAARPALPPGSEAGD